MKTERPIICVCENNGIVGLILRKDYDEASRQYWERIRMGKGWYNFEAINVVGDLGVIIPVLREKTFVFVKNSDEHNSISRRCYMERASFQLPFEGAWQYPASVEEYRVAMKHVFDEKTGAKPLELTDAFDHLYKGGSIQLIFKPNLDREARLLLDSHGKAFIIPTESQRRLQMIALGRRMDPCERAITFESRGIQSLGSLNKWLAPHVEHITLLCSKK